MNNTTIITRAQLDADIDAYPFKYWSNAAGDLFNPDVVSLHTIKESELPAPLRWAYRNLWEEDAGGCCTYLVEMKNDNYGIALIGEYGEDFAEACHMTIDELFVSLKKDMEALAATEALWCAKLYAIEHGGVLSNDYNCHELAVVLPANMPKRDFVAATDAVEKLMYKTASEKALKEHIVKGILAAHEDVGEYDVVIHKINIVNEDRVDVEESFKWKLNGWEKNVTRTSFVVRDSFGYWNIACSFSPCARFK